MIPTIRIVWVLKVLNVLNCSIHTAFRLPTTLCYAKSHQSCPTLCDPIDSSPPGSAVPGILQARTLEWVAIFFSNAWKWKVKVKSLSRVQLLATPWTEAYQAPPSMGFSRQEYGVGCHCFLHRTALWPSNPTTGHTHWGNQNWKRHVYPSVHRSTVYNSQDMEAT